MMTPTATSPAFRTLCAMVWSLRIQPMKDNLEQKPTPRHSRHGRGWWSVPPHMATSNPRISLFISPALEAGGTRDTGTTSRCWPLPWPRSWSGGRMVPRWSRRSVRVSRVVQQEATRSNSYPSMKPHSTALRGTTVRKPLRVRAADGPVARYPVQPLPVSYSARFAVCLVHSIPSPCSAPTCCSARSPHRPAVVIDLPRIGVLPCSPRFCHCAAARTLRSELSSAELLMPLIESLEGLLKLLGRRLRRLGWRGVGRHQLSRTGQPGQPPPAGSRRQTGRAGPPAEPPAQL